MDIRQTLFKYRSYTPIPFLLVLLLLAQPTIISFVAGFCFVLVGEFFRLWGVSFAGSETRTTGPVGASSLITSGPFSYVRNPLYLGNLLMYTGFGVMANLPALALAGFLYFFLQYTLIVSLEEEQLTKKFLDEYVRYFESVPRFIPVCKKYEGAKDPQPKIDWGKGLRSERRTLQATILVIILIVIIWIVRGQQ
ncbi:MAG: isoprenylcysteine carboxylmethyltransferase family protein [Ignavibacteriales bacterium]|nr:isoprenylcysteine carboxylmethyltransferase family protein [Ignavibacteriales bacterium]